MAFPHWGDIPTWIGSGSFFIAASAYWRSVLDREKEQAGRVTAWYQKMRYSEEDQVDYLLVRNSSDAAVYIVTAGDGAGRWLAIPPGQTVEQGLIPEYWSGRDLYAAPSLTFRDATGRVWDRNTHGVLRLDRSASRRLRRHKEISRPVLPGGFSYAKDQSGSEG